MLAIYKFLTVAVLKFFRDPQFLVRIRDTSRIQVILKSNGTWQYINEASSNQKEESTLSFDTGIVFRSGDVKSLARTTFYLLDNSLAELLVQAGYKDDNNKTVTNPQLLYVDYIYAANGYNVFEKDTIRYNLIWSILKPHVVQTVTTDFGGKATINKIPSGKYFLLGYANIMKNKIIWDTEVSLTPGNNSCSLDQNNAALILD